MYDGFVKEKGREMKKSSSLPFYRETSAGARS